MKFELIERENREEESDILEHSGAVLPNMGMEKGDSREGKGSDPNVDESVRVGVGNARVTAVSRTEILVHSSPSSFSDNYQLSFLIHFSYVCEIRIIKQNSLFCLKKTLRRRFVLVFFLFFLGKLGIGFVKISG